MKSDIFDSERENPVLPSSIRFFPLDFARASRPLSVFSHFVCGIPDAVATGKKAPIFTIKKALGWIALTAGINRAWLSTVFSRCAFLNYSSTCDIDVAKLDWH